MKYTSFVVAAALASVQSVRGLMVNTPTSVVQCQPILFTWQDGTPPYYFSLIPGGQPSAPALQSWDATDATSFTWVVSIPAGTSITPSVRDSTGAIAYADAVTVQSGGGQTNCTSSGAPPPVGSGGSAAPAPTTGAASAAPAPAPSGSSPASAASTHSESGSASSVSHPTGSQAAVASAKPSNAAVSGFSVDAVTGGLASFIAVVGTLVL